MMGNIAAEGLIKDRLSAERKAFSSVSLISTHPSSFRSPASLASSASTSLLLRVETTTGTTTTAVDAYRCTDLYERHLPCLTEWEVLETSVCRRLSCH